MGEVQDGSSKNRKRQRQRSSSPRQPKSTQPNSSSPSFLDATAAVSVATFGSRRLPELERLYSKIASTSTSKSSLSSPPPVDILQPFRSGGGKISSRHLRRRTTSIKSRKHFHRYPTAQQQHQHQTQDSPQPQPEWEGRSRKSRRKKTKLLMEPHLKWLYNSRQRQTKTDDGGDDNKKEGGIRATTDPAVAVVNWLTTHLWHTKRCHIHHNLWGWNVPMMHTNRGPRAALRLSQTNEHCLLRDVSWETQPAMYIQVSSPSETMPITTMIEGVLQNLGRVSPHLLSSALQQQQQQQRAKQETNDDDMEGETSETSGQTRVELFVQGLCIVDCYLYEVDRFPNGAIGPVTWRVVTTSTNQRSSSSSMIVEVKCHPSIRSSVIECLQNLIDTADSTTIDENNDDDNDNDNTSTMERLAWKQVDMLQDHEQQPKICFRLYGERSTRLLNELFDLTTIVHEEDSVVVNQQHRKQSTVALKLIGEEETNKSHKQDLLYDGMIVMANLKLKENKSSQSFDEMDAKVDPSLDLQQSTTKPRHGVMLVYRSPRPLDCDSNRAVSGWDIWCYSNNDEGGDTTTTNNSFSHALWMELVLNNCCVIGLVEDVHLKLECEPPIPIFPRDAVDTSESRIYWNNVAASDSKSMEATASKSRSAKTKDWSFVRHQYEGGWGRVKMHVTPTKAKYQHYIDFSSLVQSNDSNGEDAAMKSSDEKDEGDDNERITSSVQHEIVDPIVVRGDDFLTPFLEALHCCGRLPVTWSEKSDQIAAATYHHRHRKRRRGSPEKTFVFAETRSIKERSSAAAQCHHLLSSLSLPAVLLVHIRSLGKGTVDPGMSIYGCNFAKQESRDGIKTSINEDENDDDEDNKRRTSDRQSHLLLGRITAGNFSPSRGVCHGIGIISAWSMLRYLIQCCSIDNNESQRNRHSGLVVVRLPNGTKSLQLSVMVGQIDSRRRHLHPACISLIATA